MKHLYLILGILQSLATVLMAIQPAPTFALGITAEDYAQQTRRSDLPKRREGGGSR